MLSLQLKSNSILDNILKLQEGGKETVSKVSIYLSLAKKFKLYRNVYCTKKHLVISNKCSTLDTWP